MLTLDLTPLAIRRPLLAVLRDVNEAVRVLLAASRGTIAVPLEHLEEVDALAGLVVEIGRRAGAAGRLALHDVLAELRGLQEDLAAAEHSMPPSTDPDDMDNWLGPPDDAWTPPAA